MMNVHDRKIEEANRQIKEAQQRLDEINRRIEQNNKEIARLERIMRIWAWVAIPLLVFDIFWIAHEFYCGANWGTLFLVISTGFLAYVIWNSREIWWKHGKV